MRRTVVLIITAALAITGVVLYKRSDSATTVAAGSSAPAGGSGGRMGRGGPRAPMPVEFATVSRGTLSEQILVVGNLIGAATVDVAPRVTGRLETISVKLGDTVRRGQMLAKVEDQELQQQVRQAQASYQVAEATIRQRQADLNLAKANLDRSRSLVDRELLPQQSHDDTVSRHQAAQAQLDLAEAQFEQTKARLDELKITLSNTSITSPVDGFVGKRYVDPGAFVGTTSPVVSVVDIRTVRLVANLVERDVRQVRAGTPAVVEVDAYPGEQFSGSVSRVAPVFDPSTRTAEMEIEVPNPGYRLKPGMYARVQLTVDTRGDALTVPRNAIVDAGGQTGVFIAEAAPEGGPGAGGDGGPAGRGPQTGARGAPQAEAPVSRTGRSEGGSPASGRGPAGGGASAPGQPNLIARFVPVETGIRTADTVEIVSGLREGARVITVGAGALRDGERILLAVTERTGQEGRGARGDGQRESRPEGTR
jgi:membrane fusion protein, multidrug efflux system